MSKEKTSDDAKNETFTTPKQHLVTTDSPMYDRNNSRTLSNHIPLEEQVIETSYDHGWTDTVQFAFERYRTTCQIKQKEHTDSQRYFSKWYRWTTYPILIFASTNSIIAAINATENEATYSLAVAIMTGVHTLLLALANFVEYGKRASYHNLSSSGYASIERYINSQILVKPAERDSPKFNFEVISREFEAIAANEPLVPMFITRKYAKQKPGNIVTPCKKTKTYKKDRHYKAIPIHDND